MENRYCTEVECTSETVQAGASNSSTRCTWSLPQKGEGPSRRGNLLHDRAGFDNREGLGKTHRQLPVIVA